MVARDQSRDQFVVEFQRERLQAVSVQSSTTDCNKFFSIFFLFFFFFRSVHEDG